MHYARAWSPRFSERAWSVGPVADIGPDFRILEFPPFGERRAWTYATCCMSQRTDRDPIELHLLAPSRCDAHVELLTAVAHYHRRGAPLGLGHTVNFGRPWLPGSAADHGLVSLPYLDGPALEWLILPDSFRVRFLWLVPVTAAEVAYAKRMGLEALERAFEEGGLDYLDPARESVV